MGYLWWLSIIIMIIIVATMENQRPMSDDFLARELGLPC